MNIEIPISDEDIDKYWIHFIHFPCGNAERYYIPEVNKNTDDLITKSLKEIAKFKEREILIGYLLAKIENLEKQLEQK